MSRRIGLKIFILGIVLFFGGLRIDSQPLSPILKDDLHAGRQGRLGFEEGPLKQKPRQFLYEFGTSQRKEDLECLT